MTRLIDFHCHLDLYPDFEQLIRECDEAQVYTLAVTTTPQAWPRVRDLCEQTKFVRAGLGLHPQLVEDRWREIALWERYLPETRYVGEVGLDAGPKYFRSLDKQKELLTTILKACSSAGGKVLSVHSVRTGGVILDLIEKHLAPNRGTVVMHWFSGTIREAHRATELGCYFSINRRMIETENGIKLLRTLPRDRLLTESDGPFTLIDGIPARPTQMNRTVSDIGRVLDLHFDQCAELFLANLRALLGEDRGLP